MHPQAHQKKKKEKKKTRKKTKSGHQQCKAGEETAKPWINHFTDSLSSVRHSSFVSPQPRAKRQNTHCPKKWSRKQNPTHPQSLINSSHQETQHILMEQETMPEGELGSKRIKRKDWKNTRESADKSPPAAQAWGRSLLRGC